MTNVVDLTARFKKKQETDPDLFGPHPDFNMGINALIMDTHDQFRMIETILVDTMTSALGKNTWVLDVGRLVSIAKYLMDGIILPFGGNLVSVKTNGVIGDEKFMVTVSRMEPTTKTIDFMLHVFFEELDVAGKEVYLNRDKVQFLDSPYTGEVPFRAATLKTIVARMNQLVIIHGGFCDIVDHGEDGKVVALCVLPFAKQSISIQLQGNMRRAVVGGVSNNEE